MSRINWEVNGAAPRALMPGVDPQDFCDACLAPLGYARVVVEAYSNAPSRGVTQKSYHHVCATAILTAADISHPSIDAAAEIA